MARKRNTRNSNDTARSLPWGPMLLSFAVGAFIMFLLHLKDNVPEDTAGITTENVAKTKEESNEIEPEFDFYTLLPETEVMVDNQNQGDKPIVTSPAEPQVEENTVEETVAEVDESVTGNESEVVETAKPVVEKNSVETPKLSYIIQAGSFKSLPDAEAYRANLSLITGIEAKVQTVTIDNTDTWHRVQIGPISGRDTADALQKKLQQNNIDSLLMQAKHS